MRPIYKEVATLHRIHDTPTSKEIKKVVKLAKEHGLESMIQITVELNQPGFVSSNMIGHEFAPYQYRRWFEKYIRYVKRYAKVAQKCGAEILSIGHNLNNLSKWENFWVEIIEAARKEFKGKVTYSASIQEEFKGIGFWEDLDYIGVSGDIDYDIHKDTTEDHIQDHISDFNKKIEYLAKTWKKPALITLMVAQPSFETSGRTSVSRIHHDAQANYLKGFLSGIKENENLKGVFVGNWVPHPSFGGDEDASTSP